MEWREVTWNILLTLAALPPFVLGYAIGFAGRGLMFLYAAFKAGLKAGAGITED